MVACFAAFGSYGAPEAFTDGFAAALVIGAAFAALAGVAGGGPLVRILDRVTRHTPVPATTSAESDQFALTRGSE
jgi:hypothetical protein